MNSQIFYTPKNPAAHQARLALKTSPALQWLSAIVLVAAVILFPERPAWGQELDTFIAPSGQTTVQHIALVQLIYGPAGERATALDANVKAPPATGQNSLIAKTIGVRTLRLDQIKLSYADLNSHDIAGAVRPCMHDSAGRFESQKEIQLSALMVSYTDRRLR